MTKVYFKDKQNEKVYVEVSADISEYLQASRRAEWRNNSKEKYHREASMYDINDCDEELGCDTYNPEAMIIAEEERAELASKLKKLLTALTPAQLRLVKMLHQDMSLQLIADTLGVTRSAVSHMRLAIEKKLKKL